MEMGALTVPVIAIVIGEGGSGGALALSVANQIWMLENAVYSILSPEGFAAILWKDGSRAQEACELMKLTAQDLYDFKIVERIFSEPRGDLCDNAQIVYKQIKRALQETLPELMHMTEKALVEQRYKKFRTIGDCSDNIL